MLCPSCGRETVSAETCAHCGAALVPARRLPLGLFQWASLLLAVAGVFALLVSASHTAVPQVKIGDVGTTMNLAYVRVSGAVISSPQYDPDSNYLSFRIDDGTGELTVSSYRAETQTLVANRSVPELGDTVTLEGTLRLREDSTALTLAAPERLTIDRAAPLERAIGSITVDDDQKRVVIKGQLREIREPYPGLKIYAVRDSSGEIDAALYGDAVALTGQPSSITVGNPVQIIGIVTIYRDSPQLAITSSSNLQPLTSNLPLAALRQTGSLTTADAGALVQVVGTLGMPETFAAGVKFALDDGTGPISLLIWSDVYKEIGELAEGSIVQVVGSIDVYRDSIELIPAAAADVKVLTAAEAAAIPTPVPIPTPTPLPGCADAACTPIANAAVGETATVQGQIVLAESYAGGFKFGLRDSTGTITLLLPESVYKAISNVETLRPGAVVRATGRVGVYRGDTQIEPPSAADVSIITPGRPSDDLPIAIGQIALGDVNDTLTIEGNITAAETFSKGLRVTVTDDTGSITLLLWQNVLNYVPDSGKLTTGSRVRVTGLIQVYQGALEIVPQIGFDVVIGK